MSIKKIIIVEGGSVVYHDIHNCEIIDLDRMPYTNECPVCGMSLMDEGYCSYCKFVWGDTDYEKIADRFG